MQHCYIKETIEFSLEGCQPLEFFYQFFVLYKKIRSTRNRRLSRITRSAPAR